MARGAERRSVQVVADWDGLGGPTPMGTLHAVMGRSRETFSFEYDGAWLPSARSIELDPALRLLPGPQFVAAGRDYFGVFLDSAPDRWGRVLLDRREAYRARREGRAARALRELDYLLGVYDGHRLGALRFRLGGGPFLDDDARLASPPWTSLAELERASLALERGDAEEHPDYGRWLGLLLAPGRSLGGARPKASVVDARADLWLAKFPSRADTHDVGGWEGVVASLARAAGVLTSETKIARLGSTHHTFLARRFDRRGRGRLHVASAMTLLERRDGEEGASYLDLAELLARSGAHPARDLEQLWRRIAFFVCVANVDDHLRNHAFVLERTGWSLAPAYDVNPVPTGRALTLAISETDATLDLDLVLDVAASFRVRAARARAILREVTSAVGRWRAEAKAARIPRAEQDRMAEAFGAAERRPRR